MSFTITVISYSFF